MKEIVRAIFLLAVIYLLLFFLVNTNRTCQVIQGKPETKTITVTDTLTQVLYDTIFIDHFETVKLPLIDTIVVDSLRIDSVFVEVPISVYKFDTTLTTDTTCLNIRIQNSGYDVKLDSLSYNFKYTPTKTKKIHWFIGPSLGIGYDFTSGKLIPTVGIGIIIKRF